MILVFTRNISEKVCVVYKQLFNDFQGGMGGQGMMFGGDQSTSTQVTIPKDVSILNEY